MDFTVKHATYQDLAACVVVEQETMGDYCYLQEAWHYFDQTKGDLVCVYDGEKMIGIGKFTVLFDGSGWLETLRVIPSYQNKGAGKAIYKDYLAQAAKFSCPSMAMFTGVSNAASAGLAAINGLSKAAQHRGYHLTNLQGGSAHQFQHVTWQRAVELILPLKQQYNDYMVFNRTFFHINEPNAKGFAIEGKVFEDKQSNSFIVCGGRFQHGATLHIAMMGGDYDKCIDFAINYAKAQGIAKISCTFALNNPMLEEKLKQRGFESEKSDLITMEIKF